MNLLELILDISAICSVVVVVIILATITIDLIKDSFEETKIIYKHDTVYYKGKEYVYLGYEEGHYLLGNKLSIPQLGVKDWENIQKRKLRKRKKNRK